MQSRGRARAPRRGIAVPVRHGTRRWPAWPPRSSDTGSSLLEVVISMGVVGIIMAGITVFFVSSRFLINYQGQLTGATQLAADGMERVRALPVSAIVAGRDQRTVQQEWLRGAVPGVAPLLSQMEQVWDAAAPNDSGSAAALPTTGQSETVNGVPFARYWYVGRCWLTPTSTGCDVANKTATGAREFYRVVVGVTWPHAYCAPTDCGFVTSTLVTANRRDPLFVVPSEANYAAVWAHRSSPGVNTTPALRVSSNQGRITGLVHSNSDLEIGGSGISVGPTIEYVTAQRILAGGLPAPEQVAVGSTRIRQVADHRPGGPAAVAAGAGYYAVPSSACTAGTWTYNGTGPAATATVVYVPCVATLDANIKALVVAEGLIRARVNGLVYGDAANPGAGGLITNSNASPAIRLEASPIEVYGNVQAINGRVEVMSSMTLHCGVTGDTVGLLSNRITVTVADGCVR